jgi:hypothetical protein
MNGTVYMNPNATAEVEFIVRQQAARDGIRVMPSRPFPWNRKAVRQMEKDSK